MKNKYIFSSILIVCILLCQTSCTEDTTSTTIKLNNFSLEIPLYNSEYVTVRSNSNDDFYTFSGNTDIFYDDIIFKIPEKFKNYPIRFTVRDVKVKISKTENRKSGTSVKDFVSETISENTLVARYVKNEEISLGDEFSDEGLTRYLEDIFSTIQQKKKVNISVQGKTDIGFSETEGDPIGLITLMASVSIEMDTLGEEIIIP